MYRLKTIYRHFKVGSAIFCRIGHVACAHVHLQRRNDQARHSQRGIAGLPKGDEIFHAATRTDMDVAALLFTHGAFPGIGFAPRCLVIMADENPRLIRQCQNPLHRRVHCCRRAAGEIAARGAEIGHEKGVADKRRVADDIG